MWPEKNPRIKVSKESPKVQESKESPMCVASMATQFFAGEVPNLKLNSPRKDDESPENLGTMARRIMAEPEDQDMDEAGDGFAPLLKLEGGSLLEALQQARSDDFIRYTNGYLQSHVTSRMTSLYDHVCEERERLRGVCDAECVELPHWYPKTDENGGLSRQHRLSAALDFDVWQWYSISGEDFSLLDALVWMGVHMQRLFEGS